MKIAKYILPIFFLATNLWARPNVIVVMTDDQGYPELSAHGNPVLQTPNLDRLDGQSVRLSDYHVSPMCTPTRGQPLTGLDAARNGQRWISTPLARIPLLGSASSTATVRHAPIGLGSCRKWGPSIRPNKAVLANRLPGPSPNDFRNYNL